MRPFIFIAAALLIASCELTDNNPVNEMSGIRMVKLIAGEDDLERLFNNRQTNLAVPVKINFEGKIYSGRLRASGGGSRYYPKFSFRVILNEGNIMGITDFSLSAQPNDPTYIKTAIVSSLYTAYGFPQFYSEPVFVTVNNTSYGIYNLVERINPGFFARRNIRTAELYKVLFEAKFTFLKVNRLEANFEKEIPDDGNYSSLAALIESSDQTRPEDIPAVMGKLMDIENYLLYHAISTIRSDPDSYSNNFYIYKSSFESPFVFLPWDYDKTFTGIIGLYGYNELIESLLRNEGVFESYRRKLKHIAENTFTEENLYPLIDTYYDKLKPYYDLDPYLVNKDIVSEVIFLKEFIAARRIEILNLLSNAQN